MRRDVIGWIAAAVATCVCVGLCLYARRETKRADAAEEAQWQSTSALRIRCDGLRQSEIYDLWHWSSERVRRGNPPGSAYLPALLPPAGLLSPICESKDDYWRQREYVLFLIGQGDFDHAAERLFHLKNDDPGTWAKLDVVMPEDDRIEPAFFLEHRGEIASQFQLSAWKRWHPSGADDSRARAFTMLDATHDAWHLAIANRPDMFPAGKEDRATALAIVDQLRGLGLDVTGPEPGTSVATWAWSALDPTLERLGTEAEAMDAANDQQEPLATLRQHRYDYRQFRDLLEAVRRKPADVPH